MIYNTFSHEKNKKMLKPNPVGATQHRVGCEPSTLNHQPIPDKYYTFL